MVNIYKRALAIVGLAGLMGACTDTPKPEIPPGSLSDAKSQSSVSLSSEAAQALALAVGDSIVHFVEGSFLQLAESQPHEQALFVAQPDKLPAVQILLQRYDARLERRALTKREEKKWNRATTLFTRKPSFKPEVQETNTAFVYQRPIQIRRRNCASCEEPSLLDFMASDVDQLRVFSAQGTPEGYEVGAVTGVWVIHFPGKAFQP